jgi:hypothetical protein
MRTLTIVCLGIVLGHFWGCESRTPEDALSTDEFVRWSRDQDITFDLFEGEGPPNAYSAYVAIYFIYDLRELPDNFKFNATIFLDKKKSYASEINELTDSLKHKMFPVLYKLKFDYYEIHARKLRKHLIEHKGEFTGDSAEHLENLAKQYYDDAEKGWDKILQEIEAEGNYNPEVFDYWRGIIDSDLNEYKDFDASVNNYN